MRKHNIVMIIKNDIVRAFISLKFLISILLGMGVCYFALLFCGNYKSSTVHKFIMLHDRSQSFLAYIIAIMAYALCFYDDFLYGNIKNVLGRIKMKEYVFSKTVTAISSTIVAFVSGKMLFVLLYSIDNPMCIPETIDEIPDYIMYISLIKNEHYLSYFFLSSFQKALYCAVLCQIVMLASILIANKAVVFCIPIAVFYVFNFYINYNIGNKFFNYTRIFDGVTMTFESDWCGLAYAVGLAYITYYLLYRLALYLIIGKVHYE